jgi:hypothetical protein
MRRPPAWMETLAGLLIPPACREHVLGDLQERYKSPAHYLADVLRTAPAVIYSRVRRTTDPRVPFMEAFALYTPFLVAAWWLTGSSFLYEQRGLGRLAIPAAAGLLALRLADAYRRPAQPPRYQPLLDAAWAVAWAMAAAVIAARIPQPITLSASSAGLLLLTALRWWLQFRETHLPASASGGAAPSPADDIPQKARKLQAEIRLGNLELLIGLSALGFLGWWTAAEGRPAGRIAGALIAATILYLAWQVGKRWNAGPARNAPGGIDSYRELLERRRDALRGIWSWYLGPYLGAMLAFALHFPLSNPGQADAWRNVAPFTSLSILWAVVFWLQIRRAVRRIQREIDALATS